MAKVKQGTEKKKKKVFKQEVQKDMALQRVKDRPYNPDDDFETYKKRTQAMGGDVFTAKEMDKKIADKKSAMQSQSRMNLRKGGKAKNTRRMNRLEELGRVDAEKAYTKKGKRNLKAEKKRIVRSLNSRGAAKRGHGAEIR